MRRIGFLVGLVVAGSTPATVQGQQRTAIDYGLATASTALIVADWSQTLQIARNPGQPGVWSVSGNATDGLAGFMLGTPSHSEANPLLGRHPSVGRVNTMLSLAVLANGAALLLPRTPRRVWYSVVIAIEAIAVTHNLSSGLLIGF